MIEPAVIAGTAGPVRQCIGCRGRSAATELVRLALADGNVMVDHRRRMAGRGASLHPRRACLDAAVSRGAFGRAFKTRVEALAESLWRDIEVAYLQQDRISAGRTTT